MLRLTNKSYSKIPLVLGILFGILLGVYFPEYMVFLKPIGDIFLNLLITAVVPLVFFAISSCLANFPSSHRVSKLVINLAVVFLGTTLMAGIVAEIALRFIPVTFDFSKLQIAIPKSAPISGNSIVQMFSVNDFGELLSQKAMLPLMVISLLLGLAARRAKAEGGAFRSFLLSGNEVVKSLLEIIMKFAPIGLGIYFGSQLAAMGPQSGGSFTRLLIVATCILLFYYLFVFSAYAYLAGGFKAVVRYWKSNLLPSATAVSTCSSIASLPSNLRVSEKMGIPAAVGNLALPLGAIVHKEGSAIVTIVGIAVITRGIAGWEGILMALFIASLMSLVVGSIPNGGYTGIFFIVAVYHLSSEVVPFMIIISTLLDPIVTLVNVTGDTTSALIVARIVAEE